MAFTKLMNCFFGLWVLLPYLLLTKSMELNNSNVNSLYFFDGKQISRATSLRHLNVGGTFITDESLFAIARSCPKMEVICKKLYVRLCEIFLLLP